MSIRLLISCVETPGHLYNICGSFSRSLEAYILGRDPKTSVQHVFRVHIVRGENRENNGKKLVREKEKIIKSLGKVREKYFIVF